jgi:hypothetical protein
MGGGGGSEVKKRYVILQRSLTMCARMYSMTRALSIQNLFFEEFEFYIVAYGKFSFALIFRHLKVILR